MDYSISNNSTNKFPNHTKKINTVPDAIIQQLQKIITQKQQAKEKQPIKRIKLLDNYIAEFLQNQGPVSKRKITDKEILENYKLNLLGIKIKEKNPLFTTKGDGLKMVDEESVQIRIDEWWKILFTPDFIDFIKYIYRIYSDEDQWFNEMTKISDAVFDTIENKNVYEAIFILHFTLSRFFKYNFDIQPRIKFTLKELE